MFDHRVHHRRPTHPKLGSDTQHRPGQLTDLAACLRARPAGQHNLAVDVIGALRPGLRVAQHLAAPPPPLVPHQPGRPSETRKIPDRNRDPVLNLGAQPTRSATVSIVTVTSSGVSHTSRTRNPSSPSSASARPIPSLMQGSPRRRCRRTAVTMAGPLPRAVDTRAYPTPQFNAKSQLSGRCLDNFEKHRVTQVRVAHSATRDHRAYQH